MTSTDNRPGDAAELRWQAEEIAREKTAQPPEKLEASSSEEMRRTLHELRVHQIELEMQNEELRMVKKDGTAFWGHLAVTAAQDADGAPVCRVVMSDVTERKRAEAALLESEQRVRQVERAHSEHGDGPDIEMLHVTWKECNLTVACNAFSPQMRNLLWV